ncbi:MAG: hypothetical protein M0C28_11170 [Candidatus Moduliflexus flocculans]|nr:hypothetical protein [Candidatus Moduliflexus flocculans]
MDGYPTDGAQAFTLLDMPELTNPEAPLVAHPLHGEPFAWNLFDTDVFPTLMVLSRTGINLWSVAAPADATTPDRAGAAGRRGHRCCARYGTPERRRRDRHVRVGARAPALRSRGCSRIAP